MGFFNFKSSASNDVASKVKSIVSRVTDVPVSRLSLNGGYYRDELDQVQVIMECEKEYEITIPEDQVENIETLGDLISYLEANR